MPPGDPSLYSLSNDETKNKLAATAGANSANSSHQGKQKEKTRAFIFSCLPVTSPHCYISVSLGAKAGCRGLGAPFNDNLHRLYIGWGQWEE